MIFAREIGAVLLGYALGCISSGYYLVRLRTGQDVRELGSGSAGSRNVSRTLGPPGFVLTFVGDLAKGGIAVWSALYLQLEPWGVMLAIVAVVAGHIWPVQLGFRGGKGLAPALGALLVFDYRIALVALLVVSLTVALARQETLGAMLAVASLPATAAIIGRAEASVIGLSALALLLMMAHRTNLQAIVRRPGVGD